MGCASSHHQSVPKARVYSAEPQRRPPAAAGGAEGACCKPQQQMPVPEAPKPACGGGSAPSCCSTGAACQPAQPSSSSPFGDSASQSMPPQLDPREELSKVTNMLRVLATIQGSPLEQLAFSVEALSQILNVSFVSVSAFSSEPVLSSTVVATTQSFARAAGHGIPVTINQEEEASPTSMHYILNGQEYMKASSPLGMEMSRRSMSDELTCTAEECGACLCLVKLPCDWQALSAATGLQAFAAVPIVHAGTIVGQLTVGDMDALGAYASGGSLGRILEVAATWMSQWLGDGGGMLPRIASMLHGIASAGDMEALVSAVCTGLQEYFKKRMHLKLRVRVALLDGRDSAVVYEEQLNYKRAVEGSANPDSSSAESDAVQGSNVSNSGKADGLSSRLRCIHHSTAVTSRDDFKHLAHNISSNNLIREQLMTAASQELIPSLPSPSYHKQARPGSCSLSPATSLGQNAMPAAPAPRKGSCCGSGSGSEGCGTTGSPGSGGCSQPVRTLSPVSSMHHDASAASIHQAPHLQKLHSGRKRPSSPPAFSFSVEALQQFSRLPARDTSSMFTGSKPSKSSGGGRSSQGDRFSSGAQVPLQSHRSLGQITTHSGEMSEEILLHMVQEAEDQDTVAWHLVAHSMSPLDRTVLANVLASKDNEGTWIRDVTSYMLEPGRPGRDIVMSAKSPPVASLVLASLPATDKSRGSTWCGQALNGTSSGDLTACTSESLSGTSSEQLLLQQHQQHQGQEQPRMAVYLVSPVTLMPLQLQAVLRELQLVLGLMSPAVSMHMHGELREEWLRARESMGHRKVPSFPYSLSVASRLSNASYSNTQVPMPKTLGGERQLRPYCATPPPVLPVSGVSPSKNSGDKAKVWDADQYGASHSSMPSSPTGFAFPRPNCFKRGHTHYSRPVEEVPQVAPLVTGLQAQLCHQMANQQHMGLFNDHKDLGSLKACQLIAEGGFSSVYKGLWQGLEVAIKVVPQRKEHSDSVREAVELAVMSTVSHPNMLGIQNFWTDVLVTPHSRNLECDRENGLLELISGISPVESCEHECVGLGAPENGDPTNLQFIQEQVNNPSERGNLSLVIVMELSDQGSLDKAIQQGCFWSMPAPGRPACLNMVSILTTLLEIAMALRHMHSMQLVHCDLKPGNVLLKSSRTDSRHFTTKLCDFGLVKFRHEVTDLTEQVRRSTFTGTVTHSPPEMLQGDPNPDYAYDVYAFGILMYEMCSLMPVYEGLSDRQVAQQVVYKNLRPTFSRRVPLEYVTLAKQCWAADPKERPNMSQVVRAISKMLMALREAPPPPRGPYAAPPSPAATPYHAGYSFVPGPAAHGTPAYIPAHMPHVNMQQGPVLHAQQPASPQGQGLHMPTPVHANMQRPLHL